MAEIETWTCSACQTSLSTRHCPTCGEETIEPGDLTLRSLIIDIVRSVTNFDSRLIRSFSKLLFHPGALTTAYLQGPRKPFIAPFPLFLLANVAFFAAQSVSTVKIFSSPLESHLRRQDWKEFAQELVTSRLAKTQVALDAFAPAFDHAVTTNAKSLVIVMTLPFALLLALMFLRSDRPAATHFVFSLHFYAFQLVLYCVELGLLMAATWIGGLDPASTLVDIPVFGIHLLLTAAYLYFAVGNVYRSNGAWRIAKVGVLVAAVGASVLAYRFFVFLFTLYTS